MRRGQRLAELSVHERLAMVERIYIRYAQSEKILAQIDYIREHSKIALDPEDCLLFTGQQGAGKTRLITHYEKKFPRSEIEKQTRLGLKKVTRVPVLTASIPPKANDKSLITELLYRLGDPCAAEGSASSLTLRLFEMVDVCEVEIIILDEFQNFIDRDSEKILRNVANRLKDILIKTKKPMVLAGMPNSVQILVDNPQLNRRFSRRMSLEPLEWDEANCNDCELVNFLQLLDEALPLPALSHLSRRETAFRLASATDGVIANVMKLVRRAAAFAISRSAIRIDLNDLFNAYVDQLADGNPKKENPFDQRPEIETRVRSVENKTSDKGGTNKRVRAAKNKGPRASEILRRR